MLNQWTIFDLILPTKNFRGGNALKNKIVYLSKHSTILKEFENAPFIQQGGNRRNGAGIHREKNLILTQRRRRTKVIELLSENFEAGNSLFITLTFSEDIRFNDLKNCNLEFDKFMRKLRYLYPKTKYLVTYSRQEQNTDNWHYHLVVNLKEIPYKKLIKMWQNGSVWIKNVYSVKGIACYMSRHFKYTEFDANESGYRSSQGLDRYTKLRSYKENEKTTCEMIVEALKHERPDRVFKTTSAFVGDYVYKEFYHN